MEIPERVKKLERKPAPVLAEKFGPLQGMRVLSTSSLVAVPFAASMFADFGAEVIHVENPGAGDPMRAGSPALEKNGKKVSYIWVDNGRNRLSMELDLRINKNNWSKEIFLGLIKVSDVWIENLVWLEQRYGITDALVREVNPHISIIHESGYGKPEFGGNPDICWRASYDLIGQAYGGWNHLVGDPKGPPTRIPVGAVDYITALMVCFSGMAGYIDAQNRNKGQVYDIAQFETTARIMGDNFASYLNLGIINKRQGNKSLAAQPYGIFKASDGYMALGAYGYSVFGRFMKALQEVTGLNPEDYPMDEVAAGEESINSPRGKELDRITTEWIASHTRKEVDALFEKYEVPCAPVYTSKDAAQDEHWIKRDDFIEYVDQTTEQKVKSFGIAPKMSATPGKVWRGAPRLGQDTDDILAKLLGYTAKEIAQIRQEKIVCR